MEAEGDIEEGPSRAVIARLELDLGRYESQPDDKYSQRAINLLQDRCLELMLVNFHSLTPIFSPANLAHHLLVHKCAFALAISDLKLISQITSVTKLALYSIERLLDGIGRRPALQGISGAEKRGPAEDNPGTRQTIAPRHFSTL